MAQSIRDVMTDRPTGLDEDTSLAEAAIRMREEDIGDVLVTQDEEICGVLTDRDLVIRGVAEGRDPQRTTIGEIASRDVITLRADESITRAVELMRERAVRRLPVCEDGGRPVGIVSIGDLAIEQDPTSALAGISSADSNR